MIRLFTTLRVLFIGLLAAWLFPLTAGWAAPAILPINELQAGMHGIGKTVVQGTKIEDFDVEILGIMKGKGAAGGDLILVRTSGDVINRTGGIAQGMSGSPVYIGGKLIGAIAYGWSLADHRVGMVTPIADMLKNLDITKPSVELIPPTEPDIKDEKLENAKPLTTPLMVSGYNSQTLQYLQTQLEPFHLVPFEVGDVPAGTQYGAIEPGSSIGVELVRGDVNIGALGTVTYVDGDKFVAFGHPFLQKGFVDFLATNAYIYTTVSSLDSPFKVGTTGDLVGTINQDRGTGIAGQLHQYPYIIPFRVSVTDQDLQRTVESDYQVVRDEALAPILGATGVYNTIQKAMDRDGGGTAKVSFEITGRGLPDEGVKRENLFYTPAKLSEISVAELHEALDMLTNNRFNPVDLFDVKVNVTVESARKTATLMSAKVASNAVVKPGDSVNIDVTLKPYRGASIVRTISYVVPKNQSTGSLMLEVRGGGMVPLTQMLLKRQGIDMDMLKPDKKLRSFSDQIDDFVHRDRNNDLVVEVLDTGAESGDTTAPSSTTAKNNHQQANLAQTAVMDQKLIGNDKKDKTSLATDYVIDGDAQVVLNVSK
ncbi:SpoIVB peptidase S55 domain-containing protein [Pelorhabdus rhamnosifermentans]|uniref:SpoIVB peptidase S55 domain-containing protein n=1 Tax=Pelorhabdus rhamnosifermentans TaxID=2772457 RepID=UPI001C05F8C2|nr:SpoIVB peptidase S55 domain-containing protein [Pelorhabdus rhamnosifermentans]